MTVRFFVGTKVSTIIVWRTQGEALLLWDTKWILSLWMDTQGALFLFVAIRGDYFFMGHKEGGGGQLLCKEHQ